MQVLHSIEQDMSEYPVGKVYAIAAFANVGVYQLMKYNPENNTATAIPCKSLWYNIESKPIWDMYAYNREEELSLQQKLTPFERVSVQVNENDLYKALNIYYTETRTNNLTDIGSSSRDETVNPKLIVPILKHFKYKNAKIDVQFQYKAESILGGSLRLQIANKGKSSELFRKEAGFNVEWSDGHHPAATVDIDSLNSAEGEFMLLWSKTGSSEYSVGRRTISITALK